MGPLLAAYLPLIIDTAFKIAVIVVAIWAVKTLARK